MQYCSSPAWQLLALAAGVDEAADADAVADLVLGDLGADLGDDAGDLVAGHQRVVDLAPLAVDGVDVGVADAGELMSKATSCGPTSRRSMVVLVSGSVAEVAA